MHKELSNDRCAFFIATHNTRSTGRVEYITLITKVYYISFFIIITTTTKKKKSLIYHFFFKRKNMLITIVVLRLSVVPLISLVVQRNLKLNPSPRNKKRKRLNLRVSLGLLHPLADLNLLPRERERKRLLLWVLRLV